MRKLATLLGALILVGCNGGATPNGDVPSASNVSMIGSGTRLAVGQGLAALAARNPEKVAQYQKAAAQVRDTVKQGIAPILEGAKLNALARTFVDQLMAKLDGVTTGEVKALVQIGINLVLDHVALPANPADRLPPSAHAYITAFFDGVANGCDDYLAGSAKAAKSLPRSPIARLEWVRQ